MIDLAFIMQEWDVIKCPDELLDEAARVIVNSLKAHSMDANRPALERCIHRLMAATGSLENVFQEGQLAVEAAIALCKVGNYEMADDVLIWAAKQIQNDGPRHGFVKLIQGYVLYKLGKIDMSVAKLSVSYSELKTWSESHAAMDERMRRHFVQLVDQIPKLQAEILTDVR